MNRNYPMSKEHKLQVPYWEVIGFDKYDQETFLMRYRTMPDPVQWVLDYFHSSNPQHSDVFELTEEGNDYSNRVGDSLNEMIRVHGGNIGWNIRISDNGQDVYGVLAECREVTEFQWTN